MKLHPILTTVFAVLLAAPLALGAAGSQLLFIADSGINLRSLDLSEDDAKMSVSMATMYTEAMLINFISVTNSSSDMAVTVQFDYYNDDLTPILSFLRVLPANATILVNPFDHMVPGPASAGLMERANVRDALFGTGELGANKMSGMKPAAVSAMGDGGFNSGRFLISVTAVGTMEDIVDDTEDPADGRANIIFPGYLVSDGMLDGTNNIDGTGAADTYNTDDSNRPEELAEGADDPSSKNVGDLSADNSRPVSFNFLIGHHTTALVGESAAGSDQTASWAVPALARPSVGDPDADATDAANDEPYEVLDGMANDHLAKILHGGMERTITQNGDNPETFATEDAIPFSNDVVDGGSLLWSSLHGTALSDQMVNFISVADEYGDGNGKYMLIAAQTQYAISLYDANSNKLAAPDADSTPGLGLEGPDNPPTLRILVSGISVYISAENDCAMDMELRRDGWNLWDIAGIVPAAASGDEDFAGLEAMVEMPEENRSIGWVTFNRGTLDSDATTDGDQTVGSPLSCTYDHGDGDPEQDNPGVADDDKLPTKDERAFTGGTMVLTDKTTETRVFVTAGQVVLKYITPSSTFGASWWLESSM